jgi:hypothetical protein
MPRGIADVLKVIVLAACPDTPLRRDGPDVRTLLATQKGILELHHARIGEEERGIIGRNQGTRSNALVSALFKKTQE